MASFDAKALRSSGVNLVQQLWAHDLSAELAVDARSSEELLAHYRDDRHSWIVIIKQDKGAVGERVLKVKSMTRKEDTDIRSSELLGWLRNELRERDQREGVKDRARLTRLSSQTDTSQARADTGQDVQVLVPATGNKKLNRRMIIEAAPTRARQLVNGLLDGPIAAIDVQDELLDAIRDTRLSDPDSWRRLIQGAPMAKRAYLTSVHALLSDMARDRKGASRNAFVYNFRTGLCIYYDLGKPERG